jgi:hypothetical protein
MKARDQDKEENQSNAPPPAVSANTLARCLGVNDPTVQPRWGKIGKQKIEDAGELFLFYCCLPNNTRTNQRQSGALW